MQTFKIGDIVELKSGGPSMTVEDVEGNRLWLVWFDKDGKEQRTKLSPAVLKAAAE